MTPKTLLSAAVITAAFAAPSQAVEIFSQGEGENKTSVALTGYVKMDIRHVNGDIAYQDYWAANYPGSEPTETSHTSINVKESRLGVNVNHGDVTGYVEIDFYGGGGNEIISNSTNPRLRHLYIKYKGWTAGQAWSTFMPVGAIAETLDFGGPFVGEAFMRAALLRYQYGNWEFAIENPETWGDGDVGTTSSALGLLGDDADPDESIPDFVARYTHKADWGWISAAALLRKVDQGGLDETSAAINIAGKINTVGKDEFKFQITTGEPGRYASAAMTPDIVLDPTTDTYVVEETTAFTVAYRHFWTETLRSTVYYGAATTEVLEKDRAQWGVNLIQSLTDKLKVGVEYGNYSISDENIQAVDSDFLQFSAQLSF